jgi:uncharacterized protein (TIGR02453 family)
MVNHISTEVFEFLEDLKKNNSRDWFQSHKERYTTCHAHMIAFADHVLEKMREIDNIETPSGKKSLFRIYRDTRFSKDKTPYKTHWGGSFSRATKQLRGGYYFHIEPGNCFVGGGFWKPNSEDIKRIRQRIAWDDQELRGIVCEPSFIDHFGELRGEKVKTAPQGFKKDHPAIDLLQHKQFLVMESFSNSEAQSSDYASKIVASFLAMRPFFDYMSEVLTTDINGEPLFKD